jgi:predicted HicB family RNase H-like nuclease
MTQLKPFLVRLRPDVRTMLERAAQEQSKSIAAVINDELEESLSGHADLESRLDKLIG